MTICVDLYIKQGYCKWMDMEEKIVILATCPPKIRKELEDLDRFWMNYHHTTEHLIISEDEAARLVTLQPVANT